MAVILSSQEHSLQKKIPNSNGEPNLPDLNQHWTNEQALHLIQCYKEYISSHELTDRWKRGMWEHIASQMREAGYANCTAGHCATKYKTMTRQYRVVTENNIIPGNKQRSCFFYDALSEVYGYVPVVTLPSDVKSDNGDDLCRGSSNNTVTSLIIDMNDDAKEQEQKCLDKIETMHQEKMEMFSCFLKTVPVADNSDKQASDKRNLKRKKIECRKCQSSSDSEKDTDDFQEYGPISDFDASRTLAIALDINEHQWSEPWSKKTSNTFMSLLEKYKSMWIDPTCKKKTLWELVASELSKETGRHFESQEVEKYFKILTEKYRNVTCNNSDPGAKLITCVHFKQLHELFSNNPNGWYNVLNTFGHSLPLSKRKYNNSSGSELLTLLKNIHTERKEEEQRTLQKLKKMHDDKMHFFHSLLNVYKKMKK